MNDHMQFSCRIGAWPTAGGFSRKGRQALNPSHVRWWRIVLYALIGLSPTLTLHLLGNFGSRISEIKHRINRSSVMTQFEMQHGAVVDS
ncbi:MAG: hypothetical protein WBQ45_08330, partial [Roseiarcus sp.]